MTISSKPARVLVLGGFLLVSITGGAAAIVVSSAADNGPGTLRQAIMDSELTVASDTITFTIGASTITLSTPLPAITHPIVIDGTTAAGYAGVPIIAPPECRAPSPSTTRPTTAPPRSPPTTR